MSIKKQTLIILAVLVAGFLLAGCAGTAFFQPSVESSTSLTGQNTTANSQPQLAQSANAVATSSESTTLNQNSVDNSQIVSQGSLVPAQSVDLSFNTTGQVSQLMVKLGDTVQAGQVLATLRGTQSQEVLDQAVADAKSAIATAQKDLVTAQQALDGLYKNNESDAAQAQLDLANAQTAYAKAVGAKISASGNRTDANTIASTQAELVLAQTAVNTAQTNYDEVSSKPASNAEKARRLVDLNNAKDHLAQVQALLNWFNSGLSANELAVLDANIASTKAALDAAQLKYDTLKAGADPQSVALDQAGIDQSSAELAAAQAQLKSAEAALSDLQLTSPIAGKVVSLDTKQGEVATPGTTVITLADLGTWYVDTKDLNELDVVNVSVGQKVSVSPESLPNLSLTGTVDSISDTYTTDKDGKILYTVHIKLDETDPRLRWGMTVVVTFNK